MGAYGHSRLREFVLGGATKSLLFEATATDPVFTLTILLIWKARGAPLSQINEKAASTV